MVVPLVNNVLLLLIAEQNESFVIKRVIHNEAVALWVPSPLKLRSAIRCGGSSFGKGKIDWEFLPTSWFQLVKSY